ncbi:hypothetical protein CEXT_607611, partial [Caerostris extrusa]
APVEVPESPFVSHKSADSSGHKLRTESSTVRKWPNPDSCFHKIFLMQLSTSTIIISQAPAPNESGNPKILSRRAASFI